MKVLVPAKINTLLYLLHKREDGYHELYSHFVPISLYDSLEIIPQNQSGITLKVDGMDFDECLQNNLVYRAAELFQEHTSNPFGMSIILKKNIPVGAGLGGGSADAAATLHVLNQLHQNPFSRKELQDLALNLGADVPFFIDPEPSEVRGVGDVIRPLKHYPLLPLLILKPSFSISTAEAFQECIPRRMKVPMKIINDKELIRNLENRFEYTLFKKYPELKELKKFFELFQLRVFFKERVFEAVFQIPDQFLIIDDFHRDFHPPRNALLKSLCSRNRKRRFEYEKRE